MSIMNLLGLFGNSTRVTHTVPVIDEETGEIGSRVATCADVQAGVHVHIRRTTVPNSQGGTTTKLTQISCLEAEDERQHLLREVAANARTIVANEAEISRLNAEVANYRRLIAGAMQIVFKMSPALGTLLSENLSEPTLTGDGTAVKIENVMFVVIIDPFQGEKITVRPVTSAPGGILERSFPIVDGRISEYDQTSILGHVDRIRKAVNDGADPVQVISLVDATSASNH